MWTSGQPEMAVLPAMMADGQEVWVMDTYTFIDTYSTTARNRNRVNRNHFDIFLRSSQKNRNSLAWVLVALTVCFTYPEAPSLG
jgi:hypothetical protein